MLINTFNDDTWEKSLRFTSNGAQSVIIDVPKDAILKEALLELEAQELHDTSVIRIGLVKNCTLEDFNLLEERLEATPWGKNTVRPGWGTSETTSFLAGETGRYRVIPMDPSTMVGAHPSFFRREFDLVIVPNGPLHMDLTNLINSGIPVITMNPSVARKLGLSSSESLHAAITNVRIHDRIHYINEQFIEDNIHLGGQRSEEGAHIMVDAMEPLDGSGKGILDTGITSQSVLVTGINRKYAYIGFTRIDQLLGDKKLFTVLHRTMEWCSMGGYITNLGIDVCGLPGGFKKLGRFSEIVDTPDFSDKINDFISAAEPNEEGNYPVEIMFYSDSPGILLIGNIRFNCAFISTIDRFQGGDAEVELGFDSIRLVRTAFVEIPRKARILSASMKVEGNMSGERIAIHSTEEGDIHGVVGSARYMIAQQIKMDRVAPVSRIGLNLSGPEGDVELDVEIRADYRGRALDEILAVSTLKGGAIKKKYAWVDVAFDNLVLKPETSYWILLKVKTGKVHWQADRKCPLGGLLKFTRDGGRSWREHDMDALFKVYYEIRSLEASPALSLLPGGDEIWCYSGEFRDSHTITDFSDFLTGYLKAHTGDVLRNDVIAVPLSVSAGSIGKLKLMELAIECELPDRETKEKIDKVSIGRELTSILELLARLKMKIDTLVENLPEELLEELEKKKIL